MTKPKQLYYVYSKHTILNIPDFFTINCQSPNSCSPFVMVGCLIILTTTLPKLHQSTNIKQVLLLCKNIIYPNWKRPWVSFLCSILVPKFGLIFLKIWNLFRLGKQYKNALLSRQKSCWFSFYMLVTFCNIVLMPLFSLLLLPLQLLTPRPVHRHAFLPLFLCCCFCLFYLTSIRCILLHFLLLVKRLQLIFVCASNRAGWELDPGGLSPTLCDSTCWNTIIKLLSLKLLMLLYSHQHEFSLWLLMLLYFLQLHSCYFVIWVTKMHE